MNLENLIPVHQLCLHHKVDMAFFTELHEFGLIEIKTLKQSHFVHKDKAKTIEKIIRFHYELDINYQGIDTIFNLLEKINSLQIELIATKNKLNIYED